jgi:cell division protein FtsW (lipid II flippase)
LAIISNFIEILQLFKTKGGAMLLKKSPFWKKKTFYQFLCPCCKKERRIPLDPQFGKAWHFFQIGIASFFFVTMGWHRFGIKGCLIFFVFFFFYELIYRIRTRSHLQCPFCGFDPIVFMTNKEKGLQKVKDHYEQNLKKEPSV